MLSGWHLPVSPFVRLADDALHITLWLQGDSLPAQVFLRCEPDNEEWLLTMEGHESHDRWRYSVSLPLYEGSQPGATASNYYGMTANSGLARWGSR